MSSIYCKMQDKNVIVWSVCTRCKTFPGLCVWSASIFGSDKILIRFQSIADGGIQFESPAPTKANQVMHGYAVFGSCEELGSKNGINPHIPYSARFNRRCLSSGFKKSQFLFISSGDGEGIFMGSEERDYFPGKLGTSFAALLVMTLKECMRNWRNRSWSE